MLYIYSIRHTPYAIRHEYNRNPRKTKRKYLSFHLVLEKMASNQNNALARCYGDTNITMIFECTITILNMSNAQCPQAPRVH